MLPPALAVVEDERTGTASHDTDPEAARCPGALDHVSCEVRDTVAAVRDRQLPNGFLAESHAHS